MRLEDLRNLAIIAHVDHGKSTLADRLLVATGVLSQREMKDQVLDSMDIERERGITIKASAVQMPYQGLTVNLIDTPGHVDFSYEVSRALHACEGALLLVDCAQGVEAQTVANAYLAVDAGLEIIPVLNKVDLPGARPEEVERQIIQGLGLDEPVLRISAKTGEGVDRILDAIVKRIPCPQGDPDAPVRALIYDAVYDDYANQLQYRGIQEIVGYVTSVHAWADDVYLNAGAVHASAGGAVTEWLFAGVQARPLASYAPVATGREVVLNGVTIIEVDGGRIRRAADYADSGALALQLGGRIELPGGSVIELEGLTR